MANKCPTCYRDIFSYLGPRPEQYPTLFRCKVDQRGVFCPKMNDREITVRDLYAAIDQYASKRLVHDDIRQDVRHVPRSGQDVDVHPGISLAFATLFILGALSLAASAKDAASTSGVGGGATPSIDSTYIRPTVDSGGSYSRWAVDRDDYGRPSSDGDDYRPPAVNSRDYGFAPVENGDHDLALI